MILMHSSDTAEMYCVQYQGTLDTVQEAHPERRTAPRVGCGRAAAAVLY